MNPLVEELLHAYAEEHRRTGDADPMPYLQRLRGADREELVALIDGFLAAAPPPAFDAERMAALRAEPLAARAVDRLVAEPLSLLEARQSARIAQDDLAARLAGSLGLAGRERAVTEAYHEIEAGLVEPERVREPIWSALAGILRTSAERLRELAVRPLPPAAPAVFARSPTQVTASAGAPPKPLDSADDREIVRSVFFD